MSKLIALCCLMAATMACGADRSPEGTVSVAAAANLGAPMRELRREFESAHPGIVLEVSFGASGVLTTQIRQGAPFAVFMSADTAFPRKLRTDGWAVTEPKVYARGRLVLFSAKPRDFSLGLRLLLSREIKVVSIANPETAPYGAAALEVLEQAGLRDEVMPKLAKAQTIAQVVQQVMGAADLGFIAKSSLFVPEMAEYNRQGVFWVDIDPNLYAPIDQAVVILRRGEGDAAVKAFWEFVFSPKAAAVLLKYGYDLPASE
jgi:molybdate transport system substrate-binding protein